MGLYYLRRKLDQKGKSGVGPVRVGEETAAVSVTRFDRVCRLVGTDQIQSGGVHLQESTHRPFYFLEAIHFGAPAILITPLHEQLVAACRWMRFAFPRRSITRGGCLITCWMDARKRSRSVGSGQFARNLSLEKNGRSERI